MARLFEHHKDEDSMNTFSKTGSNRHLNRAIVTAIFAVSVYALLLRLRPDHLNTIHFWFFSTSILLFFLFFHRLTQH